MVRNEVSTESDSDRVSSTYPSSKATRSLSLPVLTRVLLFGSLEWREHGDEVVGEATAVVIQELSDSRVFL